jgi:hypothetical protein
VLAPDLERRLGFAEEARHGVGGRTRLGEEELERDLLPELHVPRGHDDAHTAGADDAFDRVFARENVSLAYGGGHGLTRENARPVRSVSIRALLISRVEG